MARWTGLVVVCSLCACSWLVSKPVSVQPSAKPRCDTHPFAVSADVVLGLFSVQRATCDGYVCADGAGSYMLGAVALAFWVSASLGLARTSHCLEARDRYEARKRAASP